MKRTMLMVATGLALLGTAHAASFDCAKAQTRVEKLICSDVNLSKLDDAMTATYRDAQRSASDGTALTKAQRLWLTARNLCPDVACVQDIYAKRLSALRSNMSVDARQPPHETPPSAATESPKSPAVVLAPERDSVLPCMSVDECRRNPVRMETLGANWQYKRDADKLPAIRNALASGKLKAPVDELSGKNAAFCSAFKEDFLSGRHVRAIEPDYEVLSVDDPRLEPWMSPRDCPDNDDVDPYSKWLSLGLYGVPPYRFYRFELDGNKKNGPEDVVLYREAGNGYGQRYDWVDLKKCLIREVQHVTSPQSHLRMDHRDALGLLVAYRGLLMKLEYADWAKRSDPETDGSHVWLTWFVQPGGCRWEESLKPFAK